MAEITSRGNEGQRGRSGGARRLSTIAPILALGGLALAGAGFGLGWALRPPEPPNAASYGRARASAIRAQLAQMRGPYVLLAGDSYMELFAPEPLPCGREVVNAGVGGAKTEEILHLLDTLRLEPPPSAVLLSVGLNHLLAKGDPGSPSATEHFRREAAALVARLGQGGVPVLVVAVPPIPDKGSAVFDTASIARYTQILREICSEGRCTLVDPFAEARDGERFWRAKPGLAGDDLHLSNLRRYYRPLYAALCR